MLLLDQDGVGVLGQQATPSSAASAAPDTAAAGSNNVDDDVAAAETGGHQPHVSAGNEGQPFQYSFKILSYFLKFYLFIKNIYFILRFYSNCFFF